MKTPDLSRRQALQLGGAGAVAAALGAYGVLGPQPPGNTSAVTWLAIPSYSLQGTDPVRVKYLTKLLKEFQADAPLRIEPQVSSADTAAAMAKLLLQASQGRAADVAQVDGYISGRMADYAQPLDRHMERAGLRLDDWFPSLQELMTAGSETVTSLQFTTDVRVLYYRKDLVPTPPSTWDEVIRIAKPLADQGKYVLFPAGPSEGAVNTTLWPQYWSQGAELFAESGEPAFSKGPEYDAMRNSLGVVERCVSEGITPSRVATFGSEDDANADVVAGRVSMFIGGSWQAPTLDNAMQDVDFYKDWGVTPIPSTTGERNLTSAGGWVWSAFAEEARQAEVGIDWVIKAFVSDEGMASWCTAGGYLPPRESVYNHPAYEQNPFTPMFREQLATSARTRPGARKYLQTSSSMQTALSSVASGTAGATEALDAALNRIV